jgi:hypothetical protein
MPPADNSDDERQNLKLNAYRLRPAAYGLLFFRFPDFDSMFK